MDNQFERQLREKLLMAEAPVSAGDFDMIQKELRSRKRNRRMRRLSFAFLFLIFLASGLSVSLYFNKLLKSQTNFSSTTSKERKHITKKQENVVSNQNSTRTQLPSVTNNDNSNSAYKSSSQVKSKASTPNKQPVQYKNKLTEKIAKKSFKVHTQYPLKENINTKAEVAPLPLKLNSLESPDNTLSLPLIDVAKTSASSLSMELHFLPIINYLQLYPERSDNVHIYRMETESNPLENMGWGVQFGGFWLINERFSTGLKLHYSKIPLKFKLSQLIPSRGITAVVALPGSEEQSFFPGYEIRSQMVDESVSYLGIGAAFRFRPFPSRSQDLQLELAMNTATKNSIYLSNREFRLAFSYGWRLPLSKRLNISFRPEFGLHLGNKVNTTLVKTNRKQFGLGMGLEFR